MLRHFQVHRCETVAEACSIRREFGEEAVVYAGGTELLLAMKMGLAHWPHLVDVKHIPELHGVRVEGDMLVIGAAVTHHQLETDATVAERLPALARLEAQVANIRVRVAGTLAGNLAFAEPHADPPALLLALGARLRLAGASSSRVIALGEFLVGAYETVLGEDEVITAIEVPLPQTGSSAAYLNFRILERPTVGIAVAGRVVEGRIEGEPAIVLGAVNDVPTRIDCRSLVGLEPRSAAAQTEVARAARAACDAGADLAGSVEYKTHLAGVIAARALAAL
jgi:carbon-monoxide dehydrogenase medium subunit